MCHTASIIFEIPGAPLPLFSTVVFRYGVIDFSEPIVVVLIKFSGNAAQRETVAIVCPYGIVLVSADSCLRSLGNGSFSQRSVGFSCGVIDIDSQIAAVFPLDEGFRRCADDIARTIKMYDFSSDTDSGVFRQTSS